MWKHDVKRRNRPEMDMLTHERTQGGLLRASCWIAILLVPGDLHSGVSWHTACT